MIQFDDNGKISGAAVKTYLLERSRICQVSNPERNYHCFYMLCAAPPEVYGTKDSIDSIIISPFIFSCHLMIITRYYHQDLERYKVGDPRSFHYLNQSDCISLDAIDDAKEYLDTRRAMEIVGINSDEQVHFFTV